MRPCSTIRPSSMTDQIGISDGAQPVRNDHSRAASKQTIESILNQHLGHRINARCCFIENENAWVCQHRPCDAQSCRWPIEKLAPPSLNLGIVPIWQTLDKTRRR